MPNWLRSKRSGPHWAWHGVSKVSHCTRSPATVYRTAKSRSVIDFSSIFYSSNMLQCLYCKTSSAWYCIILYAYSVRMCSARTVGLARVTVLTWNQSLYRRLRLATGECTNTPQTWRKTCLYRKQESSVWSAYITFGAGLTHDIVAMRFVCNLSRCDYDKSSCHAV